MSRVCRTAIDELKADGLEVAMIRPQTVFPFPEKAVEDAAAKNSCRAVASIEMSMGQLLEDAVSYSQMKRLCSLAIRCLTCPLAGRTSRVETISGLCNPYRLSFCR